MKKLLALRPLNLGIIVATMFAMRYCIVIPLVHSISEAMDEEIEVFLTTFQFSLVVLSLVLIAAAGYIINDINDKEEDAANGIKKETFGIATYYVLSLLGIILGAYVGNEVATYKLALIQVIAVVSLWFYSFYFKGTVLLGNLIIACGAAVSILTVGIYDVVPLQQGYPELANKFQGFNFNFIAYWIVGFSVFAFLFTLAREAMKDAQDVQGDSLAGKETLAVAYGEKAVKIWVSIVHVITIASLWYAYSTYVSDKFTLVVAGIISLALGYQTLGVWLASSSKDWGFQSSLNKALSIVALVYAAGVAYMLYNGVAL